MRAWDDPKQDLISFFKPMHEVPPITQQMQLQQYPHSLIIAWCDSSFMKDVKLAVCSFIGTSMWLLLPRSARAAIDPCCCLAIR